MRKIIAATAVGLALVAGQAVAANGAAPTLQVGDRVGASLGDRNDAIMSLSAFTTWFGGLSAVAQAAVVFVIIGTTVTVVDEVSDDDES